MAISSTDLVYYLTGATSDGGAQTDADASFGNYRSSTTITTDTDNNLFDDVSGDEASDGDTEYRCLCIKNEHGSLDLTSAKVFLSDDTVGSGNTVSFAVEVPETANLTNGNAQQIANESTAPTSINTTNHNGTGSGVSDWSTATTKAGGVALNIGDHDADLGQGEIIFVWVKRVIGTGASAASAIDFAVKIEGDSAA